MTENPPIKPYVKPSPKPSQVTNVRLTAQTLNEVHALCTEKGEYKSDILRAAIEYGLPIVQRNGQGLVAAAPDMLAALQVVQGQTTNAQGRGVVQGDDMQQVWDAVAKATGANS